MRSKSREDGDVARSGRVEAWGYLIRSLGKLIWALVGVVILAAAGYYFFVKDGGPPKISDSSRAKQEVKPIQPPVTIMDQAVADALRTARSKAEALARTELSKWERELKRRVDDNFLDWYFGYWGNQVRGLKALKDGLFHWFDSDQPTAVEELTEEFQRQFAARVLQPGTSRLELEGIQQRTVNRFAAVLSRSLQETPKNYKVSRAEWEQYLDDISQQSTLVESGRQVPVTLKAFYGVTAGGAFALTGKIIGGFGKVSTSVGMKTTGRMVATTVGKIAAKTGAKVAGKVGGEFLGPIIGIGILFWDFWDHHSTVEENRPILRKSIFTYLDRMTTSLLEDPVHGVMAPVYRFEEQIAESVNSARERRRR